MKLNIALMLLTLWVPVALCNNGPAAARVNGEEISEFRLERYFAEFLEDQGRAVGNIRNPKAYKQLRQKALDALIDKELLWQEALKRGVVISDADVQRQVDQTRLPAGSRTPVLMKPASPNTPVGNWRPSKSLPSWCRRGEHRMKNRSGRFTRNTAPT
jgi:hypothetical protein